MTAEAECYMEHYPESEVDDVLRYLDERREDGASVITIASIAGCNISLSHAVDILKKLESETPPRARRVIKGRQELWFPPLSSYEKTIEQVENEKVHEVKEPAHLGGSMPCPVKGCESRVGPSMAGRWNALRDHLKKVHKLSADDVDKAIKDLKDGKPVELVAEVGLMKPCQFCGREYKAQGVDKHERYCFKNPERGKNIMAQRRKMYGDKAIEGPLPATPLGGPSGGDCQYCGEHHATRLKNHERLCKKNPNRFIASKAKRDPSAPPTPVPTDPTVPPGSELWRKGRKCSTCADWNPDDMACEVPERSGYQSTPAGFGFDEDDPKMIKPLDCWQKSEGRPRLYRHRGTGGQSIDLAQAAKDLKAMEECKDNCTIGPTVPVATLPESENIHHPAAVPLRHEALDPSGREAAWHHRGQDSRAWLMHAVQQFSDALEAHGYRSTWSVGYEAGEVQATIKGAGVRA